MAWRKHEVLGHNRRAPGGARAPRKNEDEQGALWPVILQPPVLVAIDLDQLPKAVAPVTGLVDALDRVAPADPDAVLTHLLARGLDAERQAVDLGHLLGRQGGPEIFVALSDDGQAGLRESGAVGPVSGLAMPLGVRPYGPWARKASSNR